MSVKYTHGTAERPLLNILNGPHTFEVVSYSGDGFRTAGKTKGSPCMGVVFAFYKDEKFVEPLARKEIEFIFHPTKEWEIDDFVQAAGILIDGKPVTKGAPVEFCEELLVGLRGWCEMKEQKGRKLDQATQTWIETSDVYNNVKHWGIKGKGPLPRIVRPKIEPADVPANPDDF